MSAFNSVQYQSGVAGYIGEEDWTWCIMIAPAWILWFFSAVLTGLVFNRVFMLFQNVFCLGGLHLCPCTWIVDWSQLISTIDLWAMNLYSCKAFLLHLKTDWFYSINKRLSSGSSELLQNCFKLFRQTYRVLTANPGWSLGNLHLDYWYIEMCPIYLVQHVCCT